MVIEQRKSSLADRCWECFFGFPSPPAIEQQFIQHEIERRKSATHAFCAFALLGSIVKISQLGWSQLTLWSLLLEPSCPVGTTIIMFALATRRWHWVEPTALASAFFRAVSVIMWITQPPDALPRLVCIWGTGPFSTSATSLMWALFTVLANYSTHARFRYGALQALFWASIAPWVVRRSEAALHIWPLLLFPIATAMGRLVLELRGRTRFLSLDYPHTMLNKLGNRRRVQAVSEMSDQALVEMTEAAISDMFGLLVAPRQTTMFLRIPDADPDDLKPGAKERLQQAIEAQVPGNIVSHITFQRGSLLVGISMAEAPDAKARGIPRDASAQLTQGISQNTWLSWLGLPADMDLSIRVNIPTDRQVSLLNGLPLAVSIPKSDQELVTLSFPLRCSHVPEGVAFKASLGCYVLACEVLVRSALDEAAPCSSGHACPVGEENRITLQVSVPMKAQPTSPCWLLKVNVQSLSDHVIVGDRSVVLLLDHLTQLEPELCSMRLLRPPSVARNHARGMHYGADVAFALGWWLHTMHVEHQQGDNPNVHEDDGELVKTALSKKLAGMWKSGNNLLMLLVGNGCHTAAQHVIHVLLTSPALHPCINTSMRAESSEARLGSFHDFFSGAMNPQAASVLHLAVLSGSYAMVDEVIRWSLAYNLGPSRWDAKDSAGMTPLHVAHLVNDGQMATYLLRKRDPAITHAWKDTSGGHPVGSPEQFGKRMAKLNAGMERGGRDRSRLRSTSEQRDNHRNPTSMLHGRFPSQPALALGPARTPTPVSSRAPAAQYSSNGGHCHPTHENHLPSPPLPPPAASTPSVAVPQQLGGTVATPSFNSPVKQLWCIMESFPDDECFSMCGKGQKSTGTSKLACLFQTVAMAVSYTTLCLTLVALACCLEVPLHRSFAYLHQP